MPRSKDYIPGNDAKFHAFQQELMAFVQPHVGSGGIWSIPQTDYDSLLPLQTRWENAWEVARNKDQRSHADVVEKNEARKEYEREIRQFVKEHLLYNSRITDAEKEAMGLNAPNANRIPSPVPASHPVMEIQQHDVGRHYLDIRDETTGRRAKPNGVAFVEIVYSIGKPPPLSPEDCPNTITATRSPVTVEFSGNDTGKRVYYYARWINTRSQPGPWSSQYSGIIT